MAFRSVMLLFSAVALAASPGWAETTGELPENETVEQAVAETAADESTAPPQQPPLETVAEETEAPESAPEATEPPATARPASRVMIELEVDGEIFAPAGRDAQPVREPIEMEARFAFVEWYDAAGNDAVLRIYQDAAADMRVDGAASRTALAADARNVKVALRGTTPSPYLAGAFLSRDELDLLETPFDPLLLDRLGGETGVAVGTKWNVPPDLAAGLLAIDTIDLGALEAELKSIDDGRATVAVSGIVDGAADGVPTHLVVEGTCVLEAAAVDESSWRLGNGTAATVTVRERRQASHVAPGFDIEARVAVARRQAADAGLRPDDVPTATSPVRRRGTGRPGFVWYRDPGERYDLVHDARWRLVEQGKAGIVMRFVDRGALVGQCSISALAPADAVAPPTIAEVQRDIERSLAGQFGRFEHASEATRSDGVRIVRVVSEGTAENLPFRWIHHVLTDAHGRRAAVTFMLESTLAKRFGEADRELVDGLSLAAAREEADPAAAASESTPPDREARLPHKTTTP
jgi:hypothetical protein